MTEFKPMPVTTADAGETWYYTPDGGAQHRVIQQADDWQQRVTVTRERDWLLVHDESGTLIGKAIIGFGPHGAAAVDVAAALMTAVSAGLHGPEDYTAMDSDTLRRLQAEAYRQGAAAASAAALLANPYEPGSPLVNP